MQCTGRAAHHRMYHPSQAACNHSRCGLRVEFEGAWSYTRLEGSSSRALCVVRRGVVAREAITQKTAARAPLIAVPERCLLTAAAAAEQLGPLLAHAASQSGQQQQRRRRPWWDLARQQQQRQHQQPLPPELLLALLLASERQRGADSFWWPYIAALPPSPPCGWAMPAKQLAAELAGLEPMAAGWAERVQVAAAAVERQAQAVAAAYGEQLGGLVADDISWALGHVLSRCFGSGGGLCKLYYLLDLLA